MGLINEPHGPLTAAAALPGVLAVVATAVCLAGIGMWYTRDAAGAIRTMGA